LIDCFDLNQVKIKSFNFITNQDISIKKFAVYLRSWFQINKGPRLQFGLQHNGFFCCKNHDATVIEAASAHNYLQYKKSQRDHNRYILLYKTTSAIMTYLDLV
jgi:hypothetical protein